MSQQQQGKSRQELLQEWKEQRAARSTAGNQQAGKPPARAPKASLPARPGSVRTSVEKENAAACGPQEGPARGAPGAQPSQADDPRGPPPPGQRAQLEWQYGVLEGRLQALRRESAMPLPGAASSDRHVPLAQLQPPAAGSGGGVGPAAPPAAALLGQEASAAVAAMGGQAGGLAMRLGALKRESLRPSIAPVQFEAAGGVDPAALSTAAAQLFADEQFQQLCEKGMNSQLTRSKDGATGETKIIELAGMVKLLRRGMKELQNRNHLFVELAVSYEREAAQQVESIKLASESATRAMEAELANARREAATVAAKHKNDLANWQGQLDFDRAEVGRLKRELERVQVERDRAREEAKTAETQRLALENRMKDVEKAACQQAKELQMDKNWAAQQMYELRETWERQRQQLMQSLQETDAANSELQAANTQLQRQAEGLQSGNAALNQQLGELREQRDALQVQCDELREELAMQRQQHEKVVADSACVLGELQEWQDKASALLDKLGTEQAEMAAAQQRLQSVLRVHEQDRQQWAEERAALEASCTALSQSEQGLLEEKAQLKGGLTTALEQRNELEAKLQQAAVDLQEASQQLVASVEAQRPLQQQVERQEAELVGLAETLQEVQAARDLALRELAEKGVKLAQMEGELEALQECTIGLGAGDQREMLARMVSKIAGLEAAVAAAEARRREIHNHLVELKGNIRVFCRVKPSPRSAVNCLPDGLSVRLQLDGKDHPFTFDKVFRGESSQADVFHEVSDLVQSALDGYKVCLFSFGQTGAGKTHTMQGSSSPQGQGIIPRSINKILDTVTRLREQGWEYSLEASFIEVYNETLRDLLAERGGREAGKIAEGNAIQHQPNGGHTIVLGATRAPIATEADAAAICRRAAAARAVESTAMNAVSSRSHSVFMLYITGRNEAGGTVLQGSLNLVDLAGSERLARSQAEGQRAKEACSINKSLSSLGDVFQALASKMPHVPYRNSKLTHLLQPCLGGSGKTLMFVNVASDPENAAETLCSLRFAAKVNSCETAARGGARRNVSALEAAGVTGRPSLAPTDAEARRMSLAGGALAGGLKRKAGLPLPPARPPHPRS